MSGAQVVLLRTGSGQLALLRPSVGQPLPVVPRAPLPPDGLGLAVSGALSVELGDAWSRAALGELLGRSVAALAEPAPRDVADALATGRLVALLLPWRPERPLLVVNGAAAVDDLPMRPVAERAETRAREALEAGLDMMAPAAAEGQGAGDRPVPAPRRGPEPLLPFAARVLGAWSTDPLVGAAEAVRAMQRICAAPEQLSAPYVAALWLEAAAARLRGRPLHAVAEAAACLAQAAALLGWPCLLAALVQMAPDFPNALPLLKPAGPPEAPAAPPPPAPAAPPPPQARPDQPAQAAALLAAALAGVPFVSPCDLEAG